MTKRRAATRFVLVLEALPGAPAIRQLRWILKKLLRQHDFKCIDIREVRDGDR